MAQAMLRSAAFMAYGSTHFTQPALEKAQRSSWWGATEAALTANGGRPLEQHVVAISGANAGIGFAIASAVARLGATTLLLCRSAERGQAAAEAIRAAEAAAASPPPKLEVEEVDVSSLSSIARFAQRFEASGRSLHCLVNNAGILTPGDKQVVAVSEKATFESSFATNVLGATALTLALKPALLRAANNANKDPASSSSIPRVVFVSSGGMYAAPLLAQPPLDPPYYAGDPGAPANAPVFSGTKVYSRDKRRQVALAEALGRHWSKEGILVASYHPGWADTPGVQTSIPSFREAFLQKLRQPQGGADTAVWMACAPADLSLSSSESSGDESNCLKPGAFYLDRRPQTKHVLGFNGRIAGTAYSEGDADTLLANVVALLRESGFEGLMAV
jgi:dehydrogenase/reductase SDR family protein 12